MSRSAYFRCSQILVSARIPVLPIIILFSFHTIRGSLLTHTNRHKCTHCNWVGLVYSTFRHFAGPFFGTLGFSAEFLAPQRTFIIRARLQITCFKQILHENNTSTRESCSTDQIVWPICWQQLGCFCIIPKNTGNLHGDANSRR